MTPDGRRRKMARPSRGLAAARVVSALVGASVSGSAGGWQRGRGAHGGPAAASPSTARSTPNNPRLRDIHTFALAIGDGGLGGDLAARYRGYDLVAVDGQGAPPAPVASPHQTAPRVLAPPHRRTPQPARPPVPPPPAYSLHT